MPASRSLIALLVGTVAFFALWVFALKGNSSSSSSSQGVGQYQSAINQAHQAVNTSNASNAASGNDGTSASTSASASPSSTASSSSAKASGSSQPASKAHASKKPVVHLTPKVAKHSQAALSRLSTVQHALSSHKTVVMLFYNPLGTDDQAVKQELAAVPTFGHSVVKLTIPLSEAANFTPVTDQVPVNFSPTTVLISPAGQAQQITGLVDGFVLAQYVTGDVHSPSK